MSYDRALTVFSPDGHLFQIEYAMEAVKRGTTAVGVCGKDCVVLAVEKKTISKLQDPHTMRKVYKVDNHIYMAYAGLLADARILIDIARVESHSYRLNYDSAPDVEYIADHVAQTQQRYTQKGGKRPFGVSTMLGGFNLTDGGNPHIFLTEPSGISVEWNACSIGQGQKTAREYLESHYKQEMSREDCIRLAARALLEVVESGQKNIDVVVMSSPTSTNWLPDSELEVLVQELEKEREIEQEKKRKELD